MASAGGKRGKRGWMEVSGWGLKEVVEGKEGYKGVAEEVGSREMVDSRGEGAAGRGSFWRPACSWGPLAATAQEGRVWLGDVGL